MRSRSEQLERSHRELDAHTVLNIMRERSGKVSDSLEIKNQYLPKSAAVGGRIPSSAKRSV